MSVDETRIYRLSRWVQRLKRLPGPDVSVAEAVYLDTVANLTHELDRSPEEHVGSAVRRAFAAASLGVMDARAAALLDSAAGERLAAALARVARDAVGDEPAWLAAHPAELPVFRLADPPGWARRLCSHPRAGYFDRQGLRDVGRTVESQAAHAAGTFLLAALGAPAERAILAALRALLHNAHMAWVADVPHPVEEAWGGEPLAQWERAGRQEWERVMPAGWWSCESGRAWRLGGEDPGVAEALDDADFIDRLAWLFELSPPWLAGGEPAWLADMLCNQDARRPRQEDLLRAWLEAHERAGKGA